MTVYIVLEGNYDGTALVEVHASEEQAQAVATARLAERTKDDLMNAADFWVETWKVLE